MLIGIISLRDILSSFAMSRVIWNPGSMVSIWAVIISLLLVCDDDNIDTPIV